MSRNLGGAETANCLDACQVLFQLSQTVFRGLRGNPLHDHAKDMSLLLREATLGLSDFSIGACPSESRVVAR